MLYTCLSLNEHTWFRMKILAASDTESDCAIRCTWVLSPNEYKLAKCIYNKYPVRPMYKGMFKTQVVF